MAGDDGAMKRAFDIWVDSASVGTFDYSLEVTDGIGPGDVNIVHGVGP